MTNRLIAFQARVRPHALALSTPYGSASFAELERDIARMERALLAMPGFAEAGRIAVQIANPVHFWLVTLGCWRLGRLVISLAGGEGPRHADLMALTRPDLLLCDRDQPGEIARRVTPEWIGRALAAPVAASQGKGHAPDDPMLLVTSSGTTGFPKPLVFTRRRIEGALRRWMYGGLPAGRSMTTMGLDSIGGVMAGPGAWSRGGCLVYPPADYRWENLLAPGEVDSLMITPVQAVRILKELPDDFHGAPHLYLLVGGSALPARVAQALRARVTPQLYVAYGSTETSWVARAAHVRIEGIEGAVGYPVPGMTRLEFVDPSGAPVRPGVSGEVRISGPYLAAGYEDGQSQDAFRDGGFYPGDVGRLCEDGMLVIEGRFSEFLNVGGEKYAPLAIEEALRTCPGVRDAAAFALDGVGGLSEAHAALVVDDSFRREDTHAVIAGRFPYLSLQLHGLASIPRNAMGKIDRAALRRLISPESPT